MRARARRASARGRRWRNVGLEGFDARLPSELSGGQQQRVALARALVLEPAVLLFDEPLSNLDARLRRSMREEIRALQQRLGLTVAYVTHDQERGARGERPHHRHGPRRDRADRLARRALRAPGERVRRRLHGRGDAVRRDPARRRRRAARAAARGERRAALGGRRRRPRSRSRSGPEAWRIVAARRGRAAPRSCRRRPTSAAPANTPSRPRSGRSSSSPRRRRETLQPGELAGLRLAGHGVAIVPADNAQASPDEPTASR